MPSFRTSSPLLIGVFAASVAALPAGASQEPIGWRDDESAAVAVCRNRIVFNGFVLSAPDVIVRFRSDGDSRGPSVARWDGPCSRNLAGEGAGVEPRLIISGAGADIDVSVGGNWL